MTNLAQKKPTDEPADPIVKQSLIGPLTVVTALMVLSVGYMVFDEYYWKQPWRHIYQPGYFSAANDYWNVKLQEAEARAELGAALLAKLDAIDARFADVRKQAEEDAKEIVARYREEFSALESREQFEEWEANLVKELTEMEIGDPGDANAEGLAEAEAGIHEALYFHHLGTEEAAKPEAEKWALAQGRLSADEKRLLETTAAYEAATALLMKKVGMMVGIDYRVEVRAAAYNEIDGAVTDATGLKNQRAMYLANTYNIESGRDPGLVNNARYLEEEERVNRRAPVQVKLREMMTALRNERSTYEAPRVELRKRVSALSGEVASIQTRLSGIATTGVDIQQRYVVNEGANNIVDRCESCHMGVARAGMDRDELWRVSGVFAAGKFIDKYRNYDFFEHETAEEKKRLLFEIETEEKAINWTYVEFENELAKFEPTTQLPKLSEFAETAANSKLFDGDFAKRFEARYGEKKKLTPEVKAGYGLMALAREEGFLKGEIGGLDRQPDDPANIINDHAFTEGLLTPRMRVLFRFMSRSFRTFVNENLLMFASHPDTHGLLDVHQPQNFGCTTCHSGNGRHIYEVDKAHAYYHHSLWQLLKDGYYEGGCQMCHSQQIELEGAPQLQAAKDTFMRSGCYGCHKYPGFEDQADEAMLVGKQLNDARAREQSVTAQLASLEREQRELKALGANADAHQQRRLGVEIPAELHRLNYSLYEVTRQVDDAGKRLRELQTEQKNVGPNLSQVAAKLEDNTWLARWVRYPKGFRPSTKMPHFFYGPFSYATAEDGSPLYDDYGNPVLNEENVQALKMISAYIWQASKWRMEWDGRHAGGAHGAVREPSQYGVANDPRSSAMGKYLFETRGCMGCHTTEPDIKLNGDSPVPAGKYRRTIHNEDGSTQVVTTMLVAEADKDKNGLAIKNENVYGWAANLSRVGEKNKADYIVEWILQPRKKDPHSVMPSLWTAVADFDVNAANVKALEDRVKDYFTRGGMAEGYAELPFFLNPETQFVPDKLKLPAAEIGKLRSDLTVLKAIREAKLIAAYLKSLVSPDKDKLNAPQHDVFERYTPEGGKPYDFLEAAGIYRDAVVKDIPITPVGQRDDQEAAKEAEKLTLELAGYDQFRVHMTRLFEAQGLLQSARERMQQDADKGLDVTRHADDIVRATNDIRDAREKLETTFAGYGRKYVGYYGCASCHTIPGMEDEGKIGTELVYEGSKLIERLDFGLLHEHPEPTDEKSARQATFAPLMTRARYEELGTPGFELPGEFRRDFVHHKHDYESKLVWFAGKVFSPRQYDKGKRKANWFERLRMPLFELDDEEARLITMFVNGSRETKLPQEKFLYKVEGNRKIMSDGWWIMHRYNCTGCHNIGEKEARIRRTERFSVGVNQNLNTPPVLSDAGLRLQPTWLTQWLQHPTMVRHMVADGAPADLDPGLRMPNFGLTEHEARTVTQFLALYAKAPLTYAAPTVEITPDMADFATAVIASEACNTCHEYRQDVDGYAVPGGKAPNFGNISARVRHGWVHGWITNPDLIQPTTRMTRFFLPTAGGGSIFNTDPNFGGTADNGKILSLDGTKRYDGVVPADPVATLRDYLLFGYPKTREGQQRLHELTQLHTEQKKKVP
ncbi:MAG: c-type cytochrome [Planctomycetes bacterium]|nr:c-type cytochrome [Planctomycetota bacterium]